MGNRAQRIENVLKELRDNTPGIEGAILVDNNGLLIGTALPDDMDGGKIAATAAIILSMGDNISKKSEKGNVKKILIEQENGSLLIIGISEKEVALAILCTKEAKAGLIFYEAKVATNKIREILEEQ